MTQRNFFVNHGLECGDIVISATTNTITGLSTAAPSADGDVANKKYVDDQDAAIASDSLVFTNKTFDANGTGNSITNIEVADLAAGVLDTDLSSVSASDDTLPSAKATKAYVDSATSALVDLDTTITEGNSSVVVADTGSGTITATVDGATVATFQPGDLALPNNVGLLFGTGGEKIESDGTELANGTTGVPGNDAGIVIERGDSANAFIGFDESEDKFRVGTGTFTGASTGNLTITTGTLLANIEGNVTGNVTGNADTATEATNVTITANNTANETVYLTFVDGATGTQGLETDTGLSYNPSTNVLSTTASQAQYADLAEKYTTDQEYEVGTVMMVNTSESSEVTAAMAGNIAVGVISGAPAYLMNADSEGQAVALKGRVPVKVAGAVSKGQAVYVDDNGVATASNTGSDMVGIALESNGDSGVKLVECILKV
jgi:hypothetical protein